MVSLYPVLPCMLSRLSHVRLVEVPAVGPPGFSVHGILQARILEEIAMFLQGVFPTQRSNPYLLHWHTGSLSLATPGKPLTWPQLLFNMDNGAPDEINTHFAMGDINGVLVQKPPICAEGREQLFLVNPSLLPPPLLFPGSAARSSVPPSSGSVLPSVSASADHGEKDVQS